MKSTTQIAKHLRDAHFGGNWTGVCMKEKVSDLTWKQAAKSVASMHSIATLVFHMNYYIAATIKVLEGGPLNAADEFSFDAPAVRSEQDWQDLLDKTWSDAERLALLIEALPDSRLPEVFVEEKNGTYYRCLAGCIEHCHYHLGQIALIRSSLLSD